MKKRLISSLLISVYLIAPSIEVYAVPLSSEDEKAIEEGREELSKAEADLDKVEEDIGKVSSEIDLLTETINNNKSELDRIAKEDEATKVEIQILEEDIEASEEKLGDRLNTIYKSGGVNTYLEILLSSESLSDFIGRAGALNEIINIDKEALENLTSKNEQLIRKRDRLSSNKEKINKLIEENKVKIEEEKDKKKEFDKLYEEYKKKLSSADIDLASRERKTYQYWIDIIKNENSGIEDIKKAKSSLETIQGQLKSAKAKSEVEELIKKSNSLIENKNILKSSGVSLGNISGKAGDIIAYGTQFTNGNYRYEYGANGPVAYDCSAFMKMIFGKYGISLFRDTYGQMKQGDAVSYANLQPGDLVFTHGGNHVGVYVGNGQMLHAANRSEGIIIGKIYHYYSARRVIR